jgi:hypothetical protein
LNAKVVCYRVLLAVSTGAGAGCGSDERQRLRDQVNVNDLQSQLAVLREALREANEPNRERLVLSHT